MAKSNLNTSPPTPQTGPIGRRAILQQFLVTAFWAALIPLSQQSLTDRSESAQVRPERVQKGRERPISEHRRQFRAQLRASLPAGPMTAEQRRFYAGLREQLVDQLAVIEEVLS